MKASIRLSIAALALLLVDRTPTRADFFAETAVQTHRGTHLGPVPDYSGNGVFEKNVGAGATTSTTSFEFFNGISSRLRTFIAQPRLHRGSRSKKQFHSRFHAQCRPNSGQ